MCGLTLAVHPKRDPRSKVVCCGCGHKFPLQTGLLIMGNVRIAKEDWFGFLPFCGNLCFLTHHPALGYC